jgi:hypothetical protein
LSWIIVIDKRKKVSLHFYTLSHEHKYGSIVIAPSFLSLAGKGGHQSRSGNGDEKNPLLLLGIEPWVYSSKLGALPTELFGHLL